MIVRNFTRFLKRLVEGENRSNPKVRYKELQPSNISSEPVEIASEELDDQFVDSIAIVTPSDFDLDKLSDVAAASNSSQPADAAYVASTVHDGKNKSDEEITSQIRYDVSLSEFVLSKNSSTRLNNCSHSDYFVTTSLRAALLDREAVQRECLKLDNFGKRTLTELNALLDAAALSFGVESDTIAKTPPDKTVFQFICQLFDGVSLAELCAVQPVSARLANGIAGYRSKDTAAGHLFADWRSVREDLRGQKNMGAKSIQELHELCLDFIKKCLSRNGVPEEASGAIACSILEQGSLSAELGDIATAALSDAAPFSIGSLVDEQVKSPDTLADQLLSLLDERSQDVVRRRFGFTELGAETLEHIGQSYGVTRERIRQLEAKALRKLRIYGKSLPIRTALLENGEELWLSLAGPKGFVNQADISDVSLIPASFRLLFDIAEWQLDGWLDEHARKWGKGWVARDTDMVALDAASRVIADAIRGKPLPRPIPPDVTNFNTHQFEVTINLQQDLECEGSYVLPQGVGQRTARRAARLHGSFKTAMDPYTSRELSSVLAESSRKDSVSSRYAAVLATRYPHLFIESDDDEWFAVGTPAACAPAGPIASATTETGPEGVEAEGITMASFLADILRRNGPLRLSDLQTQALKTLPADRSPASIGPSLLMHREIFDRALPGVYALREAVPLGSDLLEKSPPYLLNPEQARLFALGRRAGEPWGAYTLWTTEAEYALCRWARLNAEPALLDSLLAVASFDLWPIDSAIKEEWQAFAHEKERAFQLHFQPRAEVGYALPKADRLLAACLEARHGNHFDWMVGNRVLNKMADSHVSAGLIVLMCALGALQIDPVANWQMPQKCGPKLEELISRLSTELHDQGQLSWNSELGRQILGEVDVTAEVAGSWIDLPLLSAMLSSAPVEDGEDTEFDIEELNRLIAIEVGSIGWQAEDVASAPSQDREAAIGSGYRAIEVGRAKIMSDQEGEWSLDGMMDHSGD
jgi:hypothetical protein